MLVLVLNLTLDGANSNSNANAIVGIVLAECNTQTAKRTNLACIQKAENLAIDGSYSCETYPQI
jgi:hypothetical protein